MLTDPSRLFQNPSVFTGTGTAERDHCSHFWETQQALGIRGRLNGKPVTKRSVAKEGLKGKAQRLSVFKK